jgi:hypothetical protein
VIAFWYLVCVAVPVRYAVLQALALLAFALSPSARNYRFDTESLPLYHLFTILTLIGLFTGRLRLAIVAGFLLVLCRVDGALLFGGTLLVVGYRLRGRPAELGRVMLLAAGLGAAYVARNIASFRTLLPPGSGTAALLTFEQELYMLHPVVRSAWRALGSRFDLGYVTARFDLLVDNLTHLQMLPAQEIWCLLALPGVWRTGRRAGLAVPGVTFLGAFVVVWASGPMFQQWRTLSAFLPLLVLGCTMGVSAVFDGLVAFTRRAGRRRVGWAFAASALVLLGAAPIVARLELYERRETGPLWDRERDLALLDATLGGMPVASTAPWYVMAQTRSPAVSLPVDGQQAAAEVIRRYGVKWIVLVSDKGTWRDALGKGKTTIGTVVVEQVDVPGGLGVFRVRP